jgi:DNA-binding response OmpR family regulator
MPGIFEILCVDDDADTCELIAMWLKLATDDFRVYTAGSRDEALTILKGRRFDSIVLDSWLGSSSGVELCEEIRKTDHITPIIFFSAVADKRNIESAMNAGADEYLTKPLSGEKFVPVATQLSRDGREAGRSLQCFSG